MTRVVAAVHAPCACHARVPTHAPPHARTPLRPPTIGCRRPLAIAVPVIGLVANMHPAAARAELCKGMLRLLGLPNVRVAAGTDGGCTDHNDKFRASAKAYMAVSGS